jgi:Peptidase MA superfamily
MHKVSLILLLVVLAIQASVISLQGHVPPGVGTEMLLKDYYRIRKVLDSSFVHDTGTITIIYYTSNDTKKTGARLPEWGGGGAIGTDTIIVPVDRPYAFFSGDLYKITVHELVHIGLARAFGTMRVPRWFHEGLAMQLAGELSFEESTILSRAILTHSLLPLDSIEFVNRFTQARAQTAYSQSHFAMNFLTNLYGYDMLPELLDSAKVFRRFDTACVRVFGLTTHEFDSIVKIEMVRKYKYAFIAADNELFWMLILVLAIAAFVVTLIRNKQKRRRMEDDENEEVGENEDCDDETFDNMDTEDSEENKQPGPNDDKRENGDNADVKV